MQEQASTVYYRFRFLFAGLCVASCFVMLSALITTTGTNTILDTRTTTRPTFVSSSTYDTPNAITIGAYSLADVTKRAALSTGTAVYGASRSVTVLSARSGKAVVRFSTNTMRSLGNGTTAITRMIGSGTLFVLRVPGKIVGSVSHVHAMSAIIRPTEGKPIPVIDAETSDAVLKQLNEQKQQEIKQLLAAQLVANRGLAGSVVAGDAQHGGYPTQWNRTAQDSLLDSWGMYNRECVSYAAWKVHQTYGMMPYWGGIGNANEWVRNAKTASIPISATPRVHSVAISMRGYYGHAMWVEAVKGNMIYVSQYNYDLRGHYSEMWVKDSDLTYIYFN